MGISDHDDLRSRMQRHGVRRILVIKWSAMGDVALASAGLEDIVRAFPDAEIDLNTLPPWDGLYTADPRLRRVLSLPLRTGGQQLRAAIGWLREVARRSYDLVIDLQTSDRSRLLIGLLWLAGAQIPYRAGNKSVLPYNLAPRHVPPVRHALEILRDTLATVGIEARTPRPVLHCPRERRERVAALLAEAGLRTGDYVVFLPGSQAAGYLKRWGAARYVDLARELRAEGTQRVVILGGPDEVEECARIAAGYGEGALDLCGKTELLDIVPICEGARFIVGSDTGTAHVAAAAGRPMIIICGPTDPRRVLPAGENVVALQAALPCINCYRKHCAHHSCMALITPRHVLSKLADVSRRAQGADGR